MKYYGGALEMLYILLHQVAHYCTNGIEGQWYRRACSLMEHLLCARAWAIYICMDRYIYTCIHIHTHAHACTCIHIIHNEHACTWMYTHMSTHTDMHTDTHVCIYACTYAYAYTILLVILIKGLFVSVICPMAADVMEPGCEPVLADATAPPCPSMSPVGTVFKRTSISLCHLLQLLYWPLSSVYSSLWTMHPLIYLNPFESISILCRHLG